MVSTLIRFGAEIRTRPFGGYTLRWTFLMSFNTTSTAMSPRRRLVNSVFPLRFDDEKDPLYLSFVMQHSEQRSLDHLLSGLNATPRVEPRLAYSVVDLEGEIQRGLWLRNPRASSVLQIVVQGTDRRLIAQLAWSVLPCACLDPPRQLRDPLEILFVLDRPRLPSGDDLGEQGRHLLIVGRVGQLLPDDLAADVVLNRLCDRCMVPQAAQSGSNRISDAAFHDQLHEAQVVKRRNLARLISLDVGVD